MIDTPPSACVACKSIHIASRETHNTYELYQCRDCDMQFWWPFQNPGNAYYEENEEAGYVRRNTNPLAIPLFLSQRRFLRASPQPGASILDLGMGSGRFLAEASKRGYTVAGSDFDAEAIATARSLFGLTDVHQTTIEDSLKTFGGHTFDFVTLFEVIEHLDSFDDIPQLAQLLKPEGRLIISTPWRGHSPLFSAGDYPPHHLSRWSDTSIRNVLEARGFSVISITHVSVNFRRFIMKFNNWTRGWLSFNLVNKLGPKTPTTSSSNRTPSAPTTRQRVLHMLSIAKLYGLFFIPASVLYVYLWITGGRHATHLYVVAARS